MDVTAIVLKVIETIPRFLPKPKPPKADYTALFQALEEQGKIELPSPSKVKVQVVKPALTEKGQLAALKRSTEPLAEEAPPGKEVSTACIPCSRSHLSTVSGALSESLRFARESGIKHPEVQRRIMLAEDELNINERIDLAPDVLATSPPEVRQLAEEYLPRIRKLRQDLGQITSVEKLEEVAGEASILGQEFRLRALQLQGVDLSPVMRLAKEVQAGTKTMEEAKRELKEILPEEEE